MNHVYFAHRLSGPLRDENIEAAGRLMSEVTAQIPIVPYASWITLARYWPETMREKGLAVDRLQISNCDELWLVGPELSSGMKFETTYADEFYVRVFNLVGKSAGEIVEWWKKERT